MYLDVSCMHCALSSLCLSSSIYGSIPEPCGTCKRATCLHVIHDSCNVRWLQIEGVKRIDANDLDEAAAAAVRQNLELNDSKASGLVRPTQGDVRLAALQVKPHSH